MRRTLFWGLTLTVLILPIWLILSWSGALPTIPSSALVDLSLGTAVVIVPVLAMGFLTVWALRRIDRDQRLSETEKRRWRDFVFFFAPLGATLYLYKHLPRGARPTRGFGK